MNRIVYVGGVALFLVLVAFLLTDPLVWQTGVTEANVRRIRPVMTVQEVETTFGRKADHIHPLMGKAPDRPEKLAIWHEADRRALVWLDCDDRVFDQLQSEE